MICSCNVVNPSLSYFTSPLPNILLWIFISKKINWQLDNEVIFSLFFFDTNWIRGIIFFLLQSSFFSLVIEVCVMGPNKGKKIIMEPTWSAQNTAKKKEIFLKKKNRRLFVQSVQTTIRIQEFDSDWPLCFFYYCEKERLFCN